MLTPAHETAGLGTSATTLRPSTAYFASVSDAVPLIDHASACVVRGTCQVQEKGSLVISVVSSTRQILTPTQVLAASPISHRLSWLARGPTTVKRNAPSAPARRSTLSALSANLRSSAANHAATGRSKSCCARIRLLSSNCDCYGRGRLMLFL